MNAGSDRYTGLGKFVTKFNDGLNGLGWHCESGECPVSCALDQLTLVAVYDLPGYAVMSVQSSAPFDVSGGQRLARRLHYVRAYDRRELTFDGHFDIGVAQEFDLGVGHLSPVVGDPKHVVFAFEFDECRPGYQFVQQSGIPNVEETVSNCVRHQCWRPGL